MNGSMQDFSGRTTAGAEAGVSQRSLRASIGCVGPGRQRKVALTLRPACPDHGIIFRRCDLGIDIPVDHVHSDDTGQATVLTRRGASIVGVEHVLAALGSRGITNALVEVDGPEVPMLGGATMDFIFLIDCAGLIEQGPAATMCSGA